MNILIVANSGYFKVKVIKLGVRGRGGDPQNAPLTSTTARSVSD